MPVSIGVDADLLELLVAHLEENVDRDLLPFENLAQVLHADVGEEGNDVG